MPSLKGLIVTQTINGTIKVSGTDVLNETELDEYIILLRTQLTQAKKLRKEFIKTRIADTESLLITLKAELQAARIG